MRQLEIKVRISQDLRTLITLKLIDGSKFQPAELLSKNLITIRTYTDLISDVRTTFRYS
jgi:hypothetical protein